MIIKYNIDDNIRIHINSNIVSNVKLDGNTIEVEVNDDKLNRRFTDDTELYNYVTEDLVTRIANAIKSVDFKNHIHYSDVK